MPIKGVLIDISGTLISRRDWVPGMPELLDFLRGAGITPVLVSNPMSQRGLERAINENKPLEGAIGLTAERIGKKKGSPLWIDTACEALDCRADELVYVGDSKYDMYTASSRDVVYFHAGWAAPHDRYGLNVETPKDLVLILKHIFLKRELWYWRLDSFDGHGRPVSVRTLIDGNGAEMPGLKSDLISLKNGYNAPLGNISLRTFLILDLLASLYLEGLCSELGVWTTYPGSRGGVNPLSGPLLATAAALFAPRSWNPELLIRHTATKASHFLRWEKKEVPFSHQTNSMRATDDTKAIKRLQGKTVLVLDDFVTEGHASELSRNWFLKLGAEKVISVGIGKYGDRYRIQTPGGDWDPTVPSKGLPFAERTITEPRNGAALEEFRERYLAFQQES